MSYEPQYDYVLGRIVEKDTGVVSQQQLSDTQQKFEVLAVGPGRPSETGFILKPSVKKGDIVLVQKHADADTPQEILEKGQALFMASRITAVVKEGE